MKILTLIHEYPPIGGGGGRAAMDIAHTLVSRGHSVKVITAYHSGLVPFFDDHGVEVYRLRSLRKEAFRAGLPAMMGFVIAAIFKSIPIIRQWKPDLIHVHFAVPAGAAAWFLSLLTGVPYVMTVQLGDVPGASPEKTDQWFRWIKPLTPPIWKKASEIAVVSPWVHEMAKISYAVPMTVIPNGVPYLEMNPGIINIHQPPVIIFVGRFVEQKNVLTIIEVLAKLKDLQWTALLVGDGALREAIEKKISEYGLGERVILTGWITPAEVQELYLKSDILFMPSLSEGLPLVGVAAMSMGLALVMSDVGGNSELVMEGRNGYLLAPNDLDGYEHVLRNLLGHHQQLLTMRMESRKMAERFDIVKVTEQYEQLFLQVIEKR